MFEIRIFANPAGYEEIKLTGTYELFSQGIVDRRNFDSDGETFRSGAYSIFYTPESYVWAYHFDVSTEAKFREGRVHIAVCVKRGYKINGVKAVFERLKELFVKLAVNYKEELIRQIAKNNTQAFIDIVKDNVCLDDNFLNVNLNSTGKAIVTYGNDDQLQMLMETPNRRDFSGYGLIYIIPKNEYEVSKHHFSSLSYSLVNIQSYKSIPTYEVHFPDGYIAIVQSMGEQIDYNCSKKYYYPYHFSGSLRDKMDEWKVERSADGGKYTIPLSVLQPEERQLHVMVLNDRGDIEYECRELSFNFGTYDNNTGILKLRGEEVDSINVLIPKISTLKYIIKDKKISEDKVTVFVTRQYNYVGHLRKLQDRIYQITGQNLPLQIQTGDRFESFSGEERDFYRTYKPDTVKIKVQDTLEFNGCIVEYNPVTQVFDKGLNITSKPKKKVVINIVNPELGGNALKAKLKCEYSFTKDAKDKMTVPLHKPQFEIDWLPGQNLYLKISASGYKTWENKSVPKPQNNRIDIILEKANIKMSLVLILFFISVLFNVVLSVMLVTNMNHESKNKHEINELKKELNEKNDEIKELKDQYEIFKNQKEQIEAKRNEEEKISNNEIDKLKKTLEGIVYTQEDIDRWDEIAKQRNYYIKIRNIAQYRLDILNTKNMDMMKIEFLKGNNKNTFVQWISDGGKYYNAFNDCERPDGGFKTINEAWNAFDIYNKRNGL